MLDTFEEMKKCVAAEECYEARNMNLIHSLICGGIEIKSV